MKWDAVLYAAAALSVLAFGAYGYYFITEIVPVSGFEQNGLTFTIEMVLLGIAVVSLLITIAILYYSDVRDRDLGSMKEDFIAIASHEIRSPLSSIRWNLAELRTDPKLPPEYRPVVEDLYKRVCKAIDLTTTFLQSTSVNHGMVHAKDFKVIDIVPIIRDAIAHAQSLALMKKISVRTEAVLDKQIFIKGDPQNVRLVFDNLLSNAIKYSPEGALVSVSHTYHGSKPSFSIHDQGIGIPPGDIQSIFTGFHRAANAKRPGTPGSGFGLYLVKKIVTLHGGTITCDSKVNQGTVFTVTFPASV